MCTAFFFYSGHGLGNDYYRGVKKSLKLTKDFEDVSQFLICNYFYQEVQGANIDTRPVNPQDDVTVRQKVVKLETALQS